MGSQSSIPDKEKSLWLVHLNNLRLYLIPDLVTFVISYIPQVGIMEKTNIEYLLRVNPLISEIFKCSTSTYDNNIARSMRQYNGDTKRIVFIEDNINIYIFNLKTCTNETASYFINSQTITPNVKYIITIGRLNFTIMSNIISISFDYGETNLLIGIEWVKTLFGTVPKYMWAFDQLKFTYDQSYDQSYGQVFNGFFRRLLHMKTALAFYNEVKRVNIDLSIYEPPYMVKHNS